MNDAKDTASRIRLALGLVIEHYVASLPLGVKSIKGGGMPAAASKESPLPVPAHTLDVRIEAHNDLKFWTRFIMGEVKDINGNTLRYRISAEDPIALAKFIRVWADQLARLEPDDAENCADDFETHAKAITALALPDPPTGVPIGRCPVIIDVDPCRSMVRANPGEVVTCNGCGTTADLSWWQSVMRDSTSPALVTAGELISIVAIATNGEILTHEQIRQWATRGKIERAGKDLKGRTLYDHTKVTEYVKSGGKSQEVAV